MDDPNINHIFQNQLDKYFANKITNYFKMVSSDRI